MSEQYSLDKLCDILNRIEKRLDALEFNQEPILVPEICSETSSEAILADKIAQLEQFIGGKFPSLKIVNDALNLNNRNDEYYDLYELNELLEENGKFLVIEKCASMTYRYNLYFNEFKGLSLEKIAKLELRLSYEGNYRYTSTDYEEHMKSLRNIIFLRESVSDMIDAFAILSDD